MYSIHLEHTAHSLTWFDRRRDRRRANTNVLWVTAAKSSAGRPSSRGIWRKRRRMPRAHTSAQDASMPSRAHIPSPGTTNRRPVSRAGKRCAQKQISLPGPLRPRGICWSSARFPTRTKEGSDPSFCVAIYCILLHMDGSVTCSDNCGVVISPAFVFCGLRGYYNYIFSATES